MSSKYGVKNFKVENMYNVCRLHILATRNFNTMQLTHVLSIYALH